MRAQSPLPGFLSFQLHSLLAHARTVMKSCLQQPRTALQYSRASYEVQTAALEQGGSGFDYDGYNEY